MCRDECALTPGSEAILKSDVRKYKLPTPTTHDFIVTDLLASSVGGR